MRLSEPNKKIKNAELYTSIEDAARLIKERFGNHQLKTKVAEAIHEKLPALLTNGPIGIIGRNVATPDGEFSRFIALNRIANTSPVVIEHTQDKFVARNISKYALAAMPISTGNVHDAYGGMMKFKVIDFNGAEGRKISSLETLWSESLVAFHHGILLDFFPEMKNRTIEISKLFNNGFHPKEYYHLIFLLSISYGIYFEDFFSFDHENDFFDSIVLPAFNEVMNHFDLKPIIVRITKTDNEYQENPYDLFYPKEMMQVVQNRLNNA